MKTMLHVLLFAGLIALIAPVAAQVNAPCGVVDSIDYPIDGLVPGYDDFGLYRARFGGNHTGIDIGFDRWGDPVHAIAKGRVTYSDINGWDTEKGVVIVEHTFPDGSIFYSLYGHMEQTDTILFPQVGACVDQSTVLGGIGWPSRGRPHLHFEIRNFLPDDGGPGYVTDNPLDHGWFQPLDFVQLWRLKLAPGFISSTTFKTVPLLPPVMLDSGNYVIASGNLLEGGPQQGDPLWRVETDGVVIGLAGLSDDRVVAYTRSGQVMTLQHGRYSALWTVAGVEAPFLKMDDETLAFAMPGGGVDAYDATGTLLWSLPAVEASARVSGFSGSGQQIALGVETGSDDVLWRLIDSDGALAFEETFAQQPLVVPAADGSWVGLEESVFKRFIDGANHSYDSIGIAPGRSAAAAVDALGDSYFYLGDVEHTLIALGPNGEARWQIEYPINDVLAPLLSTGSGCILYALDAQGTLSLYNTADGSLVKQVELYAGGDRSSSPRARLLSVDRSERIQVSSGFLTTVTLDGWALGGETMQSCRLG